MQSFFNTERLWPKGTRRLHVYATPDWGRTNPAEDVDFHFWPVVERVRAVAADHDCVRMIPGQWLHLTVGAAADADCDRDTVVNALVEGLRYAPAFKLRLGSAMASNSAIVLDGATDGRYEVAQYLVQAVLDDVAGGAVDGGPPHMALACGIAAGDSGRITTQLRHACRPPHLDWYVTQLHIVDVTQHPDDPDGAFHQWETLATVPLVEDRFWRHPRELDCDTGGEIWHAARRAHVRYTAAAMHFGAVQTDPNGTDDERDAVAADLQAAEHRLDTAVEPCAAALATHHGRDLTAEEHAAVVDHVANTTRRAGLTMPVTDANRAGV